MFVLRCLALVVLGVGLALLGTTSCTTEDNGDIVAFCELAEDGVGIRPVADAGDLIQLDELEKVSPPDIREATTTIANASREIGEITDLRELFSRAFDLEEAVAQAREQLGTYAQNNCS